MEQAVSINQKRVLPDALFLKTCFYLPPGEGLGGGGGGLGERDTGKKIVIKRL